MPIATVHVNNRNLSGDWDGQHWDQQGARCSNNFLSGPTPPVPPASAAGGLIWQVGGVSNPDSVVFNVSVDLPGNDEILFTGVRNNTETTYLPTPTITGIAADGTPLHGGNRWDEYYNRGIYIASVNGASAPFWLNVIGGSCGQPLSPLAGLVANFLTTVQRSTTPPAPNGAGDKQPPTQRGTVG